MVFEKIFPDSLKESKFKILLTDNQYEFKSPDYESYVTDPRYFDIINMAEHNSGKPELNGFSKNDYIQSFGEAGLSKINFLISKGILEEKDGRIVTPEDMDFQVSMECLKSQIRLLTNYHDTSRMGRNEQIGTLQTSSTSPRIREAMCKSHASMRKLMNDIVKTGEFGEAHFQELINVKERLKEQKESGIFDSEEKTERISLGIILADFKKPRIIDEGSELKQ